MANDRLITLAIHTYEKATIIKSILESEGIEVALQNVNLVQPVVSSGVRVRIHEDDLPKALRIIESSDFAIEPKAAAKATTPKVLVPVDFSPHSDIASEAAFKYAANYGAEVVLLHSFISPSITSSFQLTNTLNFDFEDLTDDDVRLGIEEASQKQLDRFSKSLRDKIKAGTLPAVKFSTRLVDDVAEDAILATAREINPRLIVMGTRGAGRKERDVMGSVTAEVLDTCRHPLFTVPDGFHISFTPEAKSHILFFCDYEQQDLLALDLFHSLFPDARFHVTLINVPTKKMPVDIHDLGRGLKKYCEEHLVGYTFEVRNANINDMEAEYQQIDSERHIDFIAVPNKKRNIFSRLFNPGLAHRLLFHTDIPMMVLPV